MEARRITAETDLADVESFAADVTAAFNTGDASAIERLRVRFQAERALSPQEFRQEVQRRLKRAGAGDAPRSSITVDDARLAVAHSFGFENWQAMAALLYAMKDVSSPAAQFEAAADAVVTGDAAALASLLRESPALARARSSRLHHATLLHYSSANGVEDFRQKSPANAVEMAKLLLDAGAEVDARSDSYGGQWDTTLNLLVSSCHPADAGVQGALVETLLDNGAAIHGLTNDNSPLLTALAFHYRDAAETLARRGARVDTIVAAAALGRLDLIDRFVVDGTTLHPDVALVNVGWIHIAPTAKANLDLALVWAAMHHRTDAVERLLQKGVDPGARDQRHWTALHWAAYSGFEDLVDVLLKWKAPLEALNEYQGTVLDQTIWTTVNEELKPAHPSIIEKLIRAGAHLGRFVDHYLSAAQQPPLDPRIADLLRREQSRRAGST